MNEEEVKARIILPWLIDRGLAPDELSFETSFSLRIGTNTVVVGGRRKKTRQRARLDILVHRRGINLLVVEVKQAFEQLGEDDRDQAISYARLVHPVAPFALVTNGTDFQLYDVLTKQRLTPENTHFADGATLVLPNETRLEALRMFFSVSSENLAIFAHAQSERAMESMFGAPDDYAAIFINETHVERKDLTAAAKTFVGSKKPLFVLTGESGMGKSCVMIDLARTLADAEHAVLFFRGALIAGDILDEIASEIDWAFGAQRGVIDTVRRLADTSGEKRLVVMIDGVEDWAFPAKVQNLVGVIAHAAGLNIRLIVSCKTASWLNFTHTLGTRTGIENYIHGVSQDQPYSAQISPLSRDEFLASLEKHRTTYRIAGGVDPTLMREARSSPFMLRLMFQVKAAGQSATQTRQVARPRTSADSRDFFETYLRLAACRTGDEQVAVTVLIGTARILYENDQEWLDELALRTALQLPVTERLPNVLFDQRLLIGTGVPGMRRVGFGFGLLRNYIIAFHVRQWPAMSPTNFAAEVAFTDPSSLRAELLSFYYPYASEAQKRAVDARVHEHALDYVRTYTNLIDMFPALRDCFTPNTTSRIGLAGELRFPAYIGWYGFRCIGDDDSEVLLIPADSKDEHHFRLRAAGVDRAHFFGFVDGFREQVSADLIWKNEVLEQLEDMIEKGRLNETAAPELAEELISCILTSHEFFTSFIDPKTKRIRYPVDVEAIKTALRREFLSRHFRDEAVEAKRRRGEIEERRSGGLVYYRSDLSRDEEKDVTARVESALATGEEVNIRVRYVQLEDLKARLEMALEARSEKGITLTGPVLPLRDDLTVWRGGAPTDEVKEHCRQVLELALRCYRQMIAFNFPNLKEQFSRYQQGPVRAVLALEADFANRNTRSFLAFCNSTTSVDEAIVCDFNEARLDTRTNTMMTADGVEQNCEWRRCVELQEFLYAAYHNRLEYQCSLAIIRSWVYGWIKDEFWAVKKTSFGRTTERTQ